MGRKVTVATCALNQWALDFEGNLQRILKSESGAVGLRGAQRCPRAGSRRAHSFALEPLWAVRRGHR